MREAMLYDQMEEGRVRCKLCAHRCTIHDGARGICQVRENRDGVLHSLVYGRLISEAIDPIEKKPLFHVFPGSDVLSIATLGCNFRCAFCQNSSISQLERDQAIEGTQVRPEEVVRAAERYRCRSIAYTYTEPTVFFEYTYDVAKLAHEAGLVNVYVTNGYMTEEALDLLAPRQGERLLDAANVDLKAFTDRFYREQCGARLQPVLDSLVRLKERGVWLEVTTLVIPTLNDGDDELYQIAGFIAAELGPETPWHVSRFHPTYRLLDKPMTPAATLRRAQDIGLESGLRHVYVGNLPSDSGETTYCPHCGEVVIRRSGYQVLSRHLRQGACATCGTAIAGIGL